MTRPCQFKEREKSLSIFKESMKWQCAYRSSRGIRCLAKATFRVFFAKDHPFDHIDLCEEHKKEYAYPNTRVEVLE